MSVEERLAVMEDKLDRVLYALDGNGQPGIINRLAKLEERVDYRIKIGGAAGALGALVATAITFISKAAGIG